MSAKKLPVKKESVSQWYTDWFDSPYYHVLYGKRDGEEAAAFVDQLVHFLQPAPGCRMLDLACGKGRHAIALHKKGFAVTGVDLSEKNIEEAKKSEAEDLSFFVHDMRRMFMINVFDYVFNLFTSFGYFDNDHDDLRIVKAVHSALKPGGVFVIDFFNAGMISCQVEKLKSGKTVAGGITFNWTKKIEGRKIVKEISFADEGKDFHFTEKVQLLSPDDFHRLLDPYFTIEKIFGSYALSAFDEKKSERLILIAKKR